MKTFIHEYSSEELLNTFIKNNYILNYEGDILIQVFTSINNKKYIQFLIEELQSIVPKAKIIGTTTNGEISLHGSINHSTVISISVFSNTIIKTHLVHADKKSFQTGVNIIKPLNKDLDLKLLISFVDGLHTNGEEYLNGISSINQDIIVSGGMAGDYTKFEETYIFNEKEITSNGAVAAGFYSSSLYIHTDYSFNWETVGQKHTVEKSLQNRVYTISGMSAIDFFKYYLGNDIENLLPSLGIEFPLVQKVDDINIARSVLQKHEDGSLSFTGNIKEGTQVQFGYADIQLIIEESLQNIKNIIDSPIESLFIYSCIGRKTLLKEDINLELLPLKEIAPISGFFAYGEFFTDSEDRNKKPILLNQSMTILTISENEKKIERVTPSIFDNTIELTDLNLHRTQALSILIKRTTTELSDLNNHLNSRVEEELSMNREKDNMLNLLQTQAQLGGILEMILHQWRQPLSAITSTLSSIQVYKESNLLSDEMLEKYISDVLSYTSHLNTTIDDFRDLFKSTDTNSSILISTLLSKTLTILQAILNENKVKVTQKIDTDNIISIPVGLMMQVLLNIIKNSIDAQKINKITDPTITINVYTNEKFNVIEIIDNGGGIEESVLSKIFDKHFTTKEIYDGTGIGLHMSKQIIETKINGTLNVNNRPEGKAVFTIEIPIL